MRVTLLTAKMVIIAQCYVSIDLFKVARHGRWCPPYHGRNVGEGGTIPRAPDDCGERCQVPTMSQALSSTQCICFRKTSSSNMGAPNL